MIEFRVKKPDDVNKSIGRFISVILVLLTNGCATGVIEDTGPSPESINASAIPDAIPIDEPRSKYGNPDSYVVNGRRYYVMNENRGFVQRGIASWYGKKFHGRRTSNGETYNMYGMTAAHKVLPLPTYLEVTNLQNGKKVVVRVNDRGPFHENRIIDLSYTAAVKLDIINSGTGLVEIRSVEPGYYEKDKVSLHAVNITNGTVSGFYIQVGAYSSIMNAENQRRKLVVLNEPVRIADAVVNGNKVYRVQIGPVIDVASADKLVSMLGGIGITEHQIVIE